METTTVLKKVEYTFPQILLERLAEGRPSQAIRRTAGRITDCP